MFLKVFSYADVVLEKPFLLLSVLKSFCGNHNTYTFQTFGVSEIKKLFKHRYIKSDRKNIYNVTKDLHFK